MQDTLEDNIQHTRVISWQDGAEEAQMYRLMHLRRPLYSAERGKALSHSSTGKNDVVGGDDTPETRNKLLRKPCFPYHQGEFSIPSSRQNFCHILLFAVFLVEKAFTEDYELSSSARQVLSAS